MLMAEIYFYYLNELENLNRDRFKASLIFFFSLNVVFFGFLNLIFILREIQVLFYLNLVVFYVFSIHTI